MTTIAPEIAGTARHEPQQAPGTRACPSCLSLAAIALGVVSSSLDEIGRQLEAITARDEAASGRAAALLSKDGAR